MTTIKAHSSIMEGRIYAIILFLILGIVQVHSYPRNNHAQTGFSPTRSVRSFHNDAFPDLENPKKFHEDGEHDILALQSAPLNLNVGKVKRDVRDDVARLNRMYKMDRVAGLALQVRNAEALREREHEARLQQFRAIIEGYQRQRQSILVAINRFEREHPTLAAQLLQHRDRQN